MLIVMNNIITILRVNLGKGVLKETRVLEGSRAAPDLVDCLERLDLKENAANEDLEDLLATLDLKAREDNRE